MELLLTVALTAVLIPFVFQYQQKAIERSENIAINHEMETIQNALERYISENRTSLLKPVGKNITRVELADLSDFGISTDFIEKAKDKYQMRILKSNGANDKSVLQGVVIMSSKDITPLRTREIVELGGTNTGFIEGNKAYGNFGSWRLDTVDIGLNLGSGIVKNTGIKRDNALYLWRVPSDKTEDSTMLSALNLGGHDIIKSSFFNALGMKLDENLESKELAVKEVIFRNRPTIDGSFVADDALVSGILSSDSGNMEVANNLALEGVAKFTNFTAENLWVNNLRLGGLSISAAGNSTLKVNDAIDMTLGNINAVYVTIGFTGSITSRLTVEQRIEDSLSSNYFWDAGTNTAHFVDLSLSELNRLAALVVRKEKSAHTESEEIFRRVATNKNATVADFINAIEKIKRKVSEKYRLLKLQ